MPVGQSKNTASPGESEACRSEADGTRAKVRSVLNEDPIRHVIQYHATVAARDWQGPADAALQHAARRVTRAIGSLLPDTACLRAARLLADWAGFAPGTPDASGGAARQAAGDALGIA